MMEKSRMTENKSNRSGHFSQNTFPLDMTSIENKKKCRTLYVSATVIHDKKSGCNNCPIFLISLCKTFILTIHLEGQ